MGRWIIKSGGKIGSFSSGPKKSAQISNNQNNSSEINSNGQSDSNPEKMPTLSMFLSVCLTTQFTKQQ